MAPSSQRISPAIFPPLKEALTLAFWYKDGLRAFMTSCLGQRELVAHLDWTGYKRSIVGQLVDSLAADQHRHFDDLLNLILATADLTDPSHLKRVEDGDRKYAEAVAAVESLRKMVEPLRRLRTEEQEAIRRRETERARIEMQRAITEKLDELKAEFHEIHKMDAQPRGYALEKFLNGIFPVFDIEAKAPFKVVGEQIDGAFAFEGEFLLEAKWKSELTPPKDVDSFSMKVSRKLDNTLGLFLSMNGFQDSVLQLNSQNRSVVILMDGGDLNAVVDNRISLPELLRRKRQHASTTGEVFISAYTLLG